MRSLTLVMIALTFSRSSGFALPSPFLQTVQRPLPKSQPSSLDMMSGLSEATLVRGGASLANTVTSTLQSGPWGVLTLWGIASSVVVPLTMVRQAYSFSVGYAYSLMVIGMVLANSFCGGTMPLSMKDPSSLLALSLIFYGVRMGTFLVIRNQTVPSKKKWVQDADTRPRLKRVPLATSVSLFYALLTSPALYGLRSLQKNIVTKSGIAVAWFGVLLEAIGDLHKYWVKRGHDEDKEFVGPTGGVYRICRHPNYLGEVLFYIGLALSGISSFGSQVIPYVTTSLGVYGIVSLMSGSAKRLDERQSDRYKGQAKYDDGRAGVKAPIFPFINKD